MVGPEGVLGSGGSNVSDDRRGNSEPVGVPRSSSPAFPQPLPRASGYLQGLSPEDPQSHPDFPPFRWSQTPPPAVGQPPPVPGTGPPAIRQAHKVPAPAPGRDRELQPQANLQAPDPGAEEGAWGGGAAAWGRRAGRITTLATGRAGAGASGAGTSVRCGGRRGTGAGRRAGKSTPSPHSPAAAAVFEGSTATRPPTLAASPARSAPRLGPTAVRLPRPRTPRSARDSCSRRPSRPAGRPPRGGGCVCSTPRRNTPPPAPLARPRPRRPTRAGAPLPAPARARARCTLTRAPPARSQTARTRPRVRPGDRPGPKHPVYGPPRARHPVGPVFRVARRGPGPPRPDASPPAARSPAAEKHGKVIVRLGLSQPARRDGLSALPRVIRLPGRGRRRGSDLLKR